MNEELYLTDEQYLCILKKIEATIAQDGFRPSCFDSNALGDKYTESNCGFCCDEFTDKDTAMFPDRFPERKSMKYQGKNHRCPFDVRKEPGILGWGSGCFGDCYLFQNRRYDIKLMREMVDRVIEDVR